MVCDWNFENKDLLLIHSIHITLTFSRLPFYILPFTSKMLSIEIEHTFV